MENRTNAFLHFCGWNWYGAEKTPPGQRKVNYHEHFISVFGFFSYIVSEMECVIFSLLLLFFYGSILWQKNQTNLCWCRTYVDKSVIALVPCVHGRRLLVFAMRPSSLWASFQCHSLSQDDFNTSSGCHHAHTCLTIALHVFGHRATHSLIFIEVLTLVQSRRAWVNTSPPLSEARKTRLNKK